MPTSIRPSHTLAAVVREQTGLSWSRARNLCVQGRVNVNGERWIDPASRVPSDAVVVIDRDAPTIRIGALAESAIVLHDRDVVVVDKPSGMLSVADDSATKDTLPHHTRTLLRKLERRADAALGVVHRLDKETSGLMVFARTADAKRKLAAQFRAHDVDRLYLALVHGSVAAKRIDTHLVTDRGDGLRGSHGYFRRTRSGPPAHAKHAVTYVTPLAMLAGATLVQCRLETGRQHQVRIHLSELGHPLVGERVYVRDYQEAMIESARLMLHACMLGFVHPRTGQRVRFERQPPADFEAMVESLRPTFV